MINERRIDELRAHIKDVHKEVLEHVRWANWDKAAAKLEEHQSLAQLRSHLVTLSRKEANR